MFVATQHAGFSRLAKKGLIASFVLLFIFIFLDAVVRYEMLQAGANPNLYSALAIFVSDLRIAFEEIIVAAAILYAAARFLEGRTVFAVSFEAADAHKISLKGPDENNNVWIGRRYATPLEAQAVAAAFAERLKDAAQ